MWTSLSVGCGAEGDRTGFPARREPVIWRSEGSCCVQPDHARPHDQRPGRQRRERPHAAASQPRRAARSSPHLRKRVAGSPRSTTGATSVCPPRSAWVAQLGEGPSEVRRRAGAGGAGPSESLADALHAPRRLRVPPRPPNRPRAAPPGRRNLRERESRENRESRGKPVGAPRRWGAPTGWGRCRGSGPGRVRPPPRAGSPPGADGGAGPGQAVTPRSGSRGPGTARPGRTCRRPGR